MPTQKIPRPDWTSFFDSFTRRHEGWLVTVETMSAELGDQIEADSIPLRAVTADSGHEQARIYLTLGHTPDSHMTHIIEGAEQVWLKTGDDNADQVLDIEAQDGRTLIKFLAPAATDAVDGVAEEEVPGRAQKT